LVSKASVNMLVCLKRPRGSVGTRGWSSSDSGSRDLRADPETAWTCVQHSVRARSVLVAHLTRKQSANGPELSLNLNRRSVSKTSRQRRGACDQLALFEVKGQGFGRGLRCRSEIVGVHVPQKESRGKEKTTAHQEDLRPAGNQGPLDASRRVFGQGLSEGMPVCGHLLHVPSATQRLHLALGGTNKPLMATLQYHPKMLHICGQRHQRLLRYEPPHTRRARMLRSAAMVRGELSFRPSTVDREGLCDVQDIPGSRTQRVREPLQEARG